MASMTFNDVLKELLGYLRATDHPVLIVGWDSIQQWPECALDKLLQAGMLTVTSSAQSIECHACEKQCFMDVVTHADTKAVSTRAFIVCEDADMQSQIGQVRIPLERLQQWQSSAKQLSQVIAGLLKFEDKIICQPGQLHIRLGMLKSLKGRRWVVLNTSDLTLVINQHSIQIDELLYFENEELVIDHARIDDLLNSELLSKSKKYIPSTEKREAKKLETQAMYQDWSDEYLKLKEKHPNKSKSWYSYRISRLDIAKSKSSETIRRKLID